MVQKWSHDELLEVLVVSGCIWMEPYGGPGLLSLLSLSLWGYESLQKNGSTGVGKFWGESSMTSTTWWLMYADVVWYKIHVSLVASDFTIYGRQIWSNFASAKWQITPVLEVSSIWICMIEYQGICALVRHLVGNIAIPSRGGRPRLRGKMICFPRWHWSTDLSGSEEHPCRCLMMCM